jgi:hypothetical protein
LSETVMDTITGNGNTYVENGATLIVSSITQNALIIGNVSSAASAPVPEPDAWVLLAIAGAGILCIAGWLRNRDVFFNSPF